MNIALQAPDHRTLPEIPVVDLESGNAAELARRERQRAAALLGIGHAHYPGWALNWGDKRSRRWLEKQANPYLIEIDEIAAALGAPGTHLLNISYEWACTTGADRDHRREGCRMLRVLDWPLPGLGRHVVVARQQAPAGPWLNVTWPGFVGTLTAMAPGRFAAAFNQPPLRRRTGLLAADWLVDRIKVSRSRALPPAHLLRRVFEQAKDFAEARRMIAETPLCLPAFFVLAGTKPHEATVIERLENKAFLHEAPAAVSNHFLGPRIAGQPRGSETGPRRRLMLESLARGGRDFDWLQPPILSGDTRLAVEANARTGELLVWGFEPDGPATRPLRLAA
ncbi:MAG TPA: hypothetical protein VHA10_02045 [Hypericibacter adhaerens]|jgi:hypothetical protein|uniref:Peptidase C45 n=1 Tax=Hypericibacter adhaerens TaxID=2602016 RepID=A0A5J6NAB8_9PROT|nr:hypothetical protein [Hypericibacter adhaerens]QEX24676.1 hypothetical protein FRZ61_46170 [Hypericibacter adhaerens]HWA41962.1 hypothetical protein [Hypericibacter adhaerens]